MKIIFMFFVVLHVLVGLLNFGTETQQQQQGNINETTTTLSHVRCCLAATSSGEFVFFAGGYNSTQASDRVDIYNMTSGSWTTSTLSIPRSDLAATSSQNLVFFGGGWDGTTALDRVDIYNTLNGSWSTALSLNLIMFLQPLLLEILFSLEVDTIRMVLPMLLMCLM
jgi:hypothetical protein